MKAIAIASPEKETETNGGSHCMVCGTSGPETCGEHWICERCKIAIQAEVVAKKRKIEKEGGVPR